MRIGKYKNEASFYAGKEWTELKEAKLEADPLCEICKKKRLIVPAEEVDHIKPIKFFPWLALVWSNLQSLCKSCHSRKTAGETNMKIINKKIGKIINKVWDV